MTEKTPDGAKEGNLIGLAEAVSLLKTSRTTFYRWVRSGRIRSMKVGRQWRFRREDVERFLKGEPPRIGLPADVRPLIATLRERAAGLGGDVPDDTEKDPAAEAVALMLLFGVRSGGSDLHLSYNRTESGLAGVVRVRIDGDLHVLAEFDIRLLAALIDRLKTMADCNIHERRLPQDGRMLVTVEGRSIDCRVSFAPCAVSESATVRILDIARMTLTLDRIPFSAETRERIERALRLPSGLILSTGPTGSGKTTTLYACLMRVAGPGIKTMTVEQPVEYLLPWMEQMALNPGIGLTFPQLMRTILRSDPDVVMVGEIRDMETVHAIQQAVLTGHLVLSTLHTHDAAGALRRMLDMGDEPFLIADSVRLVVAQRLVRRLCPECGTQDVPDAAALADVRAAAAAGGIAPDSLASSFRRRVGCPRCAGTGFRGRTVISEALEVTPEIAAAIVRRATADEMRAIAVRQGMVTMAADGMRRAAAGETTVAEVRATGVLSAP